MDRLLLLAFDLETQRYALRLSAVQQVARMVAVNPLPKAPDIVFGVINVHGKIVPVLNVRRRFGLPGKREIDLNDQLIIANTLRRSVALVVDSVIGVLDLPAAQMIETNAIVPGVKHVQGITNLNGDILFVHDLDSFLSLEEEDQLHDLLGQAGGQA
jgi:purine-binding chemotaxis protein CheW